MRPITSLLDDQFTFPNDSAVADQAVVDEPVVRQGRGLRVRSTSKPSSWEFAKAKAEAAKNASTVDYDQMLLQLMVPDFSDVFRGVPNPFLRGGLFTARSKSERNNLPGVKVASLSNFDIEYKGEELRQDDLSVWMSLISRARNQPLGDKVYFTGYALIKDLGWSMNKVGYARAKACIERLKLTSLKISSKDLKAAYAGSLIRDYAWDAIDDSGNAKWMIRFEPKIAQLFGNSNTTLLEWEERKQLGTRGTLLQWLHGYYSTHGVPIPMLVTKLHELCESEEKSIPNFTIRLRKALETLLSIGFLVRYRIDNGLVSVERSLRRVRPA